MASESIISPDVYARPEEAESESESNETRINDPPLEGFHPVYRPITNVGHRERPVDGEELVNLPSRTLSDNARLDEYTRETVGGTILKPVKSHATGEIERYELVTFKVDDPENPKNWSKKYKWWCTMVVAITCFVVAFNSAVITADFVSPAREFHVSDEVALLSITFFVMGFGIGTRPQLRSSMLAPYLRQISRPHGVRASQ